MFRMHSVVEILHAHGAPPLYHEPLIDALYVVEMSTGQHLDYVCLVHAIKADRATLQLESIDTLLPLTDDL